MTLHDATDVHEKISRLCMTIALSMNLKNGGGIIGFVLAYEPRLLSTLRVRYWLKYRF